MELLLKPNTRGVQRPLREGEREREMVRVRERERERKRERERERKRERERVHTQSHYIISGSFFTHFLTINWDSLVQSSLLLLRPNIHPFPL